MKPHFIALLALAALIFLTNAENGIDIGPEAGAISASTFQCLSQSDNKFVILNAYTQNGTNPNFQANFAAAQKYFTHIDTFATLCNVQNADHKAVINQIESALGSDYGSRIFLEITPYLNCWSSDPTSNLKYVESIAAHLHLDGYHVGIFSNKTSFDSIFGKSYKHQFLNLPLWFSSDDGQDKFESEGGEYFDYWMVAEIKQYETNSNECGTQVNLDFVNGSPIYGISLTQSFTDTHDYYHWVRKNKSGKKHPNPSHPHDSGIGGELPKPKSVQGFEEDDSSFSDSEDFGKSSTGFNSFESTCEDTDCYYTTLDVTDYDGTWQGWSYQYSYTYTETRQRAEDKEFYTGFFSQSQQM